MTKVSPSPARRRGAQPGNSNRRIHGYYARDARNTRSRLGEAAVLMQAGLRTFRVMADRLAASKRSAIPTRKKREIEHQMALLYFEVCAQAAQTAVMLGLGPIEPSCPPTGSNPRHVAAPPSNPVAGPAIAAGNARSPHAFIPPSRQA